MRVTDATFRRDKILKWTIFGLEGKLLSLLYSTPIYLTGLCALGTVQDNLELHRSINHRFQLNLEIENEIHGSGFERHCLKICCQQISPLQDLALPFKLPRLSQNQGALVSVYILSSLAACWFKGAENNAVEILVDGRRQGAAPNKRTGLYSKSCR